MTATCCSSGVMRRTVTRRLARSGPRRHLQILLAIALRRQVLRRNLKLLGQDHRHRFGAPVRQRQVVVVGADRVGVAFDQEHLVAGSASIARLMPSAIGASGRY